MTVAYFTAKNWSFFQFIFECVLPDNEGDLPVLIEPLLAAIRQDRYVYIKDLHIWDYPMSIENAATLVCIYNIYKYQ